MRLRLVTTAKVLSTTTIQGQRHLRNLSTGTYRLGGGSKYFEERHFRNGLLNGVLGVLHKITEDTDNYVEIPGQVANRRSWAEWARLFQEVMPCFKPRDAWVAFRWHHILVITTQLGECTYSRINPLVEVGFWRQGGLVGSGWRYNRAWHDNQLLRSLIAFP